MNMTSERIGSLGIGILKFILNINKREEEERVQTENERVQTEELERVK